MKIRIIVAIAIPILLVIAFDQSRKFYCLDDGKCVTVWKRLGGKCFVIPGKFYGVSAPSVSHIETITNTDIAIYFVEHPTPTYIVRCHSDFSIKNQPSAVFRIVSYNPQYEYELYEKGEHEKKMLESHVHYWILFVKESWALDRNGRKL